MILYLCLLDCFSGLTSLPVTGLVVCLWTFAWDSHSPFPPNKLWFLNRFRSGFLEPWCYLANQPAFPPVLSGTIVMKDASSTEGVAQCTPEVNSRSKMADRVDQLRAFVLLLQSFVFIQWKWYAHWCHHGSQGKPAIFWFQLGTNFSGSEPIYFWSKCSERFKIRCANRNGTRSVLVEKGYQ